MYKALVFFCSLIVSTTVCLGQNSTLDQAYDYLVKKKKNSFPRTDIFGALETDNYTSRGIQHVYYNQTYNGIPIHSCMLNLTIKNEKVVYASSNFIALSEMQIIGEPEHNVHKALDLTANILNKTYRNDWQVVRSINTHFNIGKSSISTEDIFYEVVYLVEAKELLPVWLVSLYVKEESKWTQFFIHAKTGELIKRESWTSQCNFEGLHTCSSDHCNKTETPSKRTNNTTLSQTYEVFGLPSMNPDESSHIRSILSSPWSSALNASPYGWHDINGEAGEEYTITRGNNVYASEDRDADDNPGHSPDGGPNLDFQFPYTERDLLENNQDAAITNLFYLSNVLHDVWYQYGFDEPSGNFQENNYGNGGAGSDFVMADAQDGASTNNANFSTPPDGINPRMQMYNWSAPIQMQLSVTSPQEISGIYAMNGANFGPNLGQYSGTLVSANPTDACNDITNEAALSGGIALIERGDCAFVDKVKRAQDHGAIAVVVCNNVIGSLVQMGGTDPEIIIPSVMLSKTDCDTIKSKMPGVEVEFTLPGSDLKDSDFDNGVVIHEFGHGITTRLTGGPGTSSCLFGDEQMGEGWSDWFSLVLTMKDTDFGENPRGVGTYLTNQPIDGNGIRSFPYTTDIIINPHTYDDIKVEVLPHGVGSVWAAMLWEMTWGLVDEYGFDQDIYYGSGGNNKAMALVIEALKLQSCHPGFIDGRDAILAADQILFNGENQCLIWKAFAKRGLGFSATQGSSNSRSDGVEAFDLPPECNNELVIDKVAPEIILASDTLHFEIKATNQTGATLYDLSISDALPAGISFIDGSNHLGFYDASANEITVSADSLLHERSLTLTFDSQIYPSVSSELSYYQDFEFDYSDWTSVVGEGSGSFRFVSDQTYRGEGAYFVPNRPENNTQYLHFSADIPANGLLTFYHKYETEANWDGGLLELSLDGGDTWIDAGSYMILNGYNANIGTSSNPDIAGRSGFSGDSEGYLRTWVDLSIFANKNIDLRFMFGSDDNTNSTGWYIDDVMVYEAFRIVNEACVESSNGETSCDKTSTIVMPDCELYQRFYADRDKDGAGDADSPIYSCVLEEGYSSDHTDCDDLNPANFPNNSEVCDGVDNNCNGIIDENCISECPPDYAGPNAITGENTGTGGNFGNDDFETDGDIESTQNITSGEVDYDSGSGILLDMGFEVLTGSVFSGIIDGCGNTNEEQSKNIIETEKQE